MQNSIQTSSSAITFAEKNISNQDFSSRDLRSHIFEGLTAISTNLSDSNLSNSQFTKIHYPKDLRTDYPNFSSSNLSNANLSDTIFEEATFKNANLEKANLTKSQIINANFENTNLENADLSKSNTTNSSFANANLRNTNFTRAILHNANFNNCDLTQASFESADLSFTNLKDANLKDANLGGAELDGANTTGTNFEGVFEKTLDKILSDKISDKNYLERTIDSFKYILSHTSYRQKEQFLGMDDKGESSVLKLLESYDLNEEIRGNHELKNFIDNAKKLVIGFKEKNRLENGLLRTNEFIDRLNAHNTDFSNLDLSRVDFMSKDLPSEFNETLGRYENLKLEGLNFENTKFKNQENFSYADIRNVNFKNVSLQNANLDYSNLATTNFTNANLAGAKLIGAEITGANFEGVFEKTLNEIAKANSLDHNVYNNTLKSFIYILENSDLKQKEQFLNIDYRGESAILKLLESYELKEEICGNPELKNFIKNAKKLVIGFREITTSERQELMQQISKMQLSTSVSDSQSQPRDSLSQVNQSSPASSQEPSPSPASTISPNALRQNRQIS